MIVEVDAFFCDPAEFSERENLEPAAIGQDRAVPAHKSMEPAKMLNHFQPRPQEEMIGIAKDNLSADRTEFIRCHRLDRTLRADRHEDRCFDGSVSRG